MGDVQNLLHRPGQEGRAIDQSIPFEGQSGSAFKIDCTGPLRLFARYELWRNGDAVYKMEDPCRAP